MAAGASLPSWRKRSPNRHLVVCGDNPLAHRLVEELTTRFGEDVTVILPSRRRNHGPQIAGLPGVSVVEAADLDDDAFRAAHVETARALALVDEDDVGNVHAALRAQELNRALRLVIRISQNTLRYRIRTLFDDCAVLSDAALSAPSFVAAALGKQAPSHVRVPGHTLYVASSEEVPPDRVLCKLADTTSPDGLRLLPPERARADLVLAIADGAPHDPLRAHRRGPLDVLRDGFRGLVNRKLRIAFLGLVALLIASSVVFRTAGYSWSDAIYFTLLDAAGAVEADVDAALVTKVTQIVDTIVGILLIPVVTAAVVDAVVEARLDRTLGPLRRPVHGHVVVVGLGNVGSRVVAQLHDLDHPVVCVERDESAAGVPLARRLGLPIVFGDATLDETLRAAQVGSSSALVVVTSDDVANLEAGLQGREFRDDLRVVLRLFDDDFARRLEESFGITSSRSVSDLAAPAFAAAMIERQVIGTIPIDRGILLLADVPVSEGSELARRPVRDIHQPGEARVIGLRRGAAGEFDWTPDEDYVLSGDDRLVIIATRVGLGQILARSIPGGVAA